MTISSEKIVETILAIIPVVVVYFSGWAYLTYYLSMFQVDISEVNVPLYTVLIFSYQTLSAIAFIMATLLLFAITFAALRYLKKGVRVLALTVVVWTYTQALVIVAAGQAELKGADVWKGEAPEKIAVVKLVKDDLLSEEYNTCGRQRRLLSVFNTSELSYLLCRSKSDEHEAGMIYAVAQDGMIRSRRGATHDKPNTFVRLYVDVHRFVFG